MNVGASFAPPKRPGSRITDSADRFRPAPCAVEAEGALHRGDDVGSLKAAVSVDGEAPPRLSGASVGARQQRLSRSRQHVWFRRSSWRSTKKSSLGADFQVVEDLDKTCHLICDDHLKFVLPIAEFTDNNQSRPVRNVGSITIFY
jgi:hypothetical protein